MIGSWHSWVVNTLRCRGLKTKRFGEAVAKACLGRFDRHSDIFDACRGIIPDAYAIGRVGGQVHIAAVEVEGTLPVSADKLKRYAEVWFAVDCESAFLHLVVITRGGSVLLYRDESLCDAWHVFGLNSSEEHVAAENIGQTISIAGRFALASYQE